jgi:hypothetical protein
MEGNRTFIEWINHIKKPSEMESIFTEWRRLRPCKRGCGTMVDGCTVNEMCSPCFRSWLDERVKIIKYVD